MRARHIRRSMINHHQMSDVFADCLDSHSEPSDDLRRDTWVHYFNHKGNGEADDHGRGMNMKATHSPDNHGLRMDFGALDDERSVASVTSTAADGDDDGLVSLSDYGFLPPHEEGAVFA